MKPPYRIYEALRSNKESIQGLSRHNENSRCDIILKRRSVIGADYRFLYSVPVVLRAVADPKVREWAKGACSLVLVAASAYVGFAHGFGVALVCFFLGSSAVGITIWGLQRTSAPQVRRFSLESSWDVLRHQMQSSLATTASKQVALIALAASLLRNTDDAATVFGVKLHLGLPFSWRLLFVASLCMMLARLIYIVYCPRLIRDYGTPDELRRSGLGVASLPVRQDLALDAAWRAFLSVANSHGRRPRVVLAILYSVAMTLYGYVAFQAVARTLVIIAR